MNDAGELDQVPVEHNIVDPTAVLPETIGRLEFVGEEVAIGVTTVDDPYSNAPRSVAEPETLLANSPFVLEPYG